jgi:hypothetical protein
MLDHDPEKFLQAEIEELHKWFSRLYEDSPRKAKLKVYSKYNREKKRAEYILDLFFDSTSRSLPFAVPADALELFDIRLKIKERFVPEMQKQIMRVMG